MRLRLPLAGAAFFVTLSLSSNAAALPQRTFVASNGQDTNPCSIAAPCRSFATAISATATSGEVIVLDSAGYGPVTITQSVSITAPPGVYAGIFVAPGNTGIIIDGMGILVTLRGLTINGQDGGSAGIEFQQGARLNVDQCLITNVIGAGLRAYAPNGQVYISDSTVRYSGSDGIRVVDGQATIDRVRVENNVGAGISVRPAGSPSMVANAQVRNSVASGNIGAGFSVTTNDVAQGARLTIERSSALGNSYGFVANGPGLVTMIVTDSNAMENFGSGVSGNGPTVSVVVSGSTLSRNGTYGIERLGGTVTTLQNNTVEMNLLTPTFGALTFSTYK